MRLSFLPSLFPLKLLLYHHFPYSSHHESLVKTHNSEFYFWFTFLIFRRINKSNICETRQNIFFKCSQSKIAFNLTFFESSNIPLFSFKYYFISGFILYQVFHQRQRSERILKSYVKIHISFSQINIHQRVSFSCENNKNILCILLKLFIKNYPRK